MTAPEFSQSRPVDRYDYLLRLLDSIEASSRFFLEIGAYIMPPSAQNPHLITREKLATDKDDFLNFINPHLAAVGGIPVELEDSQGGTKQWVNLTELRDFDLSTGSLRWATPGMPPHAGIITQIDSFDEMRTDLARMRLLRPW